MIENSDLEIIKLSEKLYHEYGKDNVGRSYFHSFIKEILRFNFVNFLIFQFRSFPISYNIELMLSVPELWKDFSIKEWKELMAKVGKRPTEIMVPEDNGLYTDVKFLCKYLEIDALDMLVKIENISDIDKLSVLKYLQIHAIFLIKDDFDFEDFKDGYYACLDLLYETKKKLLCNSSIQEFKYDQNEVVLYTNKFFENFAGTIGKQCIKFINGKWIIQKS